MIDGQSTDQNPAELARLLKKGRAAKGWTLRQAAAETGISNGYLSLIEQGDVKSPSPRYLMALADKYDLTFDRLMALAGHPSGPGPASSPAGRGASPSAAGDLMAAPDGERNGEAWAGSPTAGADQDHDTPATVREPGPVRDAGQRPAESEEAVERQQLTALVLDDMRMLSAADIAQVRAFIAGLRAARRR